MAHESSSSPPPRGTAAFVAGLLVTGLTLFWFFGTGVYLKVFRPMPAMLAFLQHGLVYERLPEFRASFGSYADQACWAVNSMIAAFIAGFLAKFFWLIFCVPPRPDLLDDALFEQEHSSLPSPPIDHLTPLLQACPEYHAEQIQRDMFLGQIPLLTPGTDRPSQELD